MAKKSPITYLLALLFALASCNNEIFQPKKLLVTLETRFGNIKLLLYDETPEHRESFIKLIKKGTYDSASFHRIMPELWLQGGIAGELPKGMAGGLKPEINEGLFHRKGALVAARQGGLANPQQKSEAGQFYLVQGRVYSPKELDQLEQEANYAILAPLMAKMLHSDEHTELKHLADEFRQKGGIEDMRTFIFNQKNKIEETFGKQPLRYFSEKQRETYTREGGLPDFDGKYTIFGQVVEGLDVLDSLAQMPTNRLYEPLEPAVFSASIKKITEKEWVAKYGHLLIANDSLYEKETAL